MGISYLENLGGVLDYGKWNNIQVEKPFNENGGKTKMLLGAYQKFTETRRLKTIAKQVRKYGRAPRNVTQDDIFKALRMTAPKHVAEVWGVLSATIQRIKDGSVEDRGVVSVREITQAFTKRLVDAMCDSAVSIHDFNQHRMGAGSSAETDTDVGGTVTFQAGSQSGNATQTHGSSSSIYQSVGTLTAGSSYGCPGLPFNNSIDQKITHLSSNISVCSGQDHGCHCIAPGMRDRDAALVDPLFLCHLRNPAGHRDAGAS